MNLYYYDLEDGELVNYYNGLDNSAPADHIAEVEKELEKRGI